ncbi:hypothetical protein DESC_660134 [Desulfosarcina cetonica]|nr:hypothetical protein DESC_660134 [Desulfosarcina cetonica]
MNADFIRSVECLLLLLGAGFGRGFDIEKSGADDHIHLIQTGLQTVQVLVHALPDHLVDIRIGQIRFETAQLLLGGILGQARHRSVDAVQAGLGLADTVADRTGKVVVKNEKISHVAGCGVMIALAKHLQRTGRFEHGAPLDVVEGGVDQIGAGQQHEVLDIQNARGLVGPFEHHADAGEIPGFAMTHGAVHQAGEEMTAHLDNLEEALGIGQGHIRTALVGQFQVEIVQVLPHV